MQIIEFSFGGIEGTFDLAPQLCPTQYAEFVECVIVDCPFFQDVCPNLQQPEDTTTESLQGDEMPSCQEIYGSTCTSVAGDDCCVAECADAIHVLVDCLYLMMYGVDVPGTCGEPEACGGSAEETSALPEEALPEETPPPEEEGLLELPDLCIPAATEGWRSYEPLVVPCPAVGEYSTATFGVKLPQPYNVTEFLQSSPGVALGVAASHSGGANGIRLIGSKYTCHDQSCNVTAELEDAFWWTNVAILDNSNCPDHLASDRLCFDEASSTSSNSRDIYTIVLWNEGGCEGDLNIEVSMKEDLSDEEDAWQPASCFSPLLPLLFPDDNSTVMEAAEEESSCGLDEEEGIQYFPPITIPCPEVGKRIGANIHYRHPTAPGRFLPTQYLDFSMSAYHDNLTDPTSGILLHWASYGGEMESCEDMREQNLSVDDFITTGETDKSWCFGDLQAPDKVCTGFKRAGESGEMRQEDVIILNTGGCVGNLTIEAALKDSDLEVGSIGSVCFGDIWEVCRKAFDDTEELNIALPEPESTEELEMESFDRCPELLEQFPDEETACVCGKNLETNGVSVKCESCTRCDPSGEVCGKLQSYFEFTESGELFANDTAGFSADFISGRTDEIQMSASFDNGRTCVVKLNGNECDLCEFRSCEALGFGYEGLYFDCTNLAGGEIRDQCVEDATNSSDYTASNMLFNDNMECTELTDSGASGEALQDSKTGTSEPFEKVPENSGFRLSTNPGVPFIVAMVAGLFGLV